ncbi:hypothetical protein K443DRAFT_273695 [Laccaria amethystina LaAM-08-1]|uniref:Uncharacterized protein n=1 Tax=Laccaria amethystina LaAM-08-1 TaxID=1095629 RepID=A0A0C9X624_9AGAR|nr:hypothetical protein K443DRAFT_273695 [Laccaria amethystina LaAM-08-1]
MAAVDFYFYCFHHTNEKKECPALFHHLLTTEPSIYEECRGPLSRNAFRISRLSCACISRLHEIGT